MCVCVCIAFLVQLLSHVQLFMTQWTAACQASLSSTISQSFIKFMSIELVIISNHLMSSSPFAFNLSQHQGLFQWISSLHQVVKVWNFSYINSSSCEYPELISFRIDWFYPLAVQGISSVFSSTIWNYQIFDAQYSLWSTHDYRNIAFPVQMFWAK